MIDDPKCGKTNIVQDRVDLFLDMQDQFGKKVTDSKIFVLSKSMNHKVNSQIVNGSSMLLFEKFIRIIVMKLSLKIVTTIGTILIRMM